MKPLDAGADRIETWARLWVPALVAALALASIELAAMFDEPPGRSWTALGLYLINIYVIAEAIRAISRYLDRRVSWKNAGALRVVAQLGLSVAFACVYLLLIYVPLKLYEISQGADDVLAWPHIAFTLLLALIFGTALAAFQLLFDFSGSGGPLRPRPNNSVWPSPGPNSMRSRPRSIRTSCSTASTRCTD